jgi:hypothetical protein
MPPPGGDQPCPGNRRRLRDLSGHPWNHGLLGSGHGSRLARCLNPKGSKGNGPGSSALLGGVRKSVQAVQILDAFSSVPAGGGWARLTGMLGQQETHVGHAPPTLAALECHLFTFEVALIS